MGRPARVPEPPPERKSTDWLALFPEESELPPSSARKAPREDPFDFFADETAPATPLSDTVLVRDTADEVAVADVETTSDVDRPSGGIGRTGRLAAIAAGLLLVGSAGFVAARLAWRTPPATPTAPPVAHIANDRSPSPPLTPPTAAPSTPASTTTDAARTIPEAPVAPPPVAAAPPPAAASGARAENASPPPDRRGAGDRPPAAATTTPREPVAPAVTATRLPTADAAPHRLVVPGNLALPPPPPLASPTTSPTLPDPGRASAPPATVTVLTPPPIPSVPPTAPASSPAAEALGARAKEIAAIESVIGRYRQAFGALDVKGVSAVWPQVDGRTLQRAFSQLESQAFEFDSCLFDLNGRAAHASCDGRARYVTRVGGRAPRVEPRRWLFALAKGDNGWVIQSATVERR